MAKANSKRMLEAAAIAASAALMIGLAPKAKANDDTGMITWSISGSTAMRNFTVGNPGSTVGGLSILESGADPLTLSKGTYTGGSTGLQLAPSTYTSTPLDGSTGNGVRVEWHEAGSVEGILEMANDQIGYVSAPIVDAFTPRGPTSANPVWVNRNKLTATATATNTNFNIAPSDYNTYVNYNSSGTNLQGGQNRVQMAISDVKPVQGFSTGTITDAGYNPAFNATPGSLGYGRGNPALTAGSNLAGFNTGGVREQLVDGQVLNMSTDKIDPKTGTNYGSGAWNSGTINNLTTKTVAITATVFAANPGTGLTNINKTDAQWLQTTGRLKNGVDFNMTERDPNSGTRNTAALNTGVDPSWAVGEDDGGNGYATVGFNGTAQASIGAGMKFSGKTAGGGLLRPTVQNNRMAVGVLGMSDAIGATSNNSNAFPLRALAYSNTSDSQTATPVQPTASSITDGSYVIWQQEQYVTVRSPDANYSSDEVAKGDPNGDIVKLRDNVLSSVNVHFPNANSENDPADQLIANSFLLPQFMIVSKSQDGGSTSDSSSNVVNGMTQAQWRTAALNEPVITKNFNTLSAGSVTAGANSFYGVGQISSSSNTSLSFVNGTGLNVPITAQDSSGNTTTAAFAPGGNYLFGNFNQNGVRDFSAVMSAQSAQAALEGATPNAARINVADASVPNNLLISGVSSALANMNAGAGPTKGDLIVLGDYNGDGKFDGQDLYAMAHGAAVADSNTGTTLTATAANFGDKVRSAVLVKNAALNWMNTHATAEQKIEATANATTDPNGVNAFNIFDVNRDGLVNRSDAQVVDHFVTKDYRNLTDQLGATIGIDGKINPAEAQKPISLVDAELNDTGDITASGDFKLIRDNLIASSSLSYGDANFDGTVNSSDFDALAGNFGQTTAQKWSTGDFNLDGVTNALDFNALASNYGTILSGDIAESAMGAAVPEPTSFTLAIGALALLARRRRANCRQDNSLICGSAV